MLHEGEYPSSLDLKEWSAELLKTEIKKEEKHFRKGDDHQINYGWGFLLLSILGVSFLAVVIAFYRRRFSLLVNVLFNWKLSKQIIRYEKVHSHPVNVLLMITFLIFFPFFYSLSLSQIQSELEFSYLLKVFSLFILAYFLGKFLLYQFSSWLFEEKDLFNQYVFQLNLYTKLMGVLLLILWVFLVYSPISAGILFNLSLIFLLIFLGLQTFRGLVIGRSEGKPLLLIILYLCTLEILPWFLIYKSLENNW